MYKKILVPLDGSRRAEAILPHVEDLAHRSHVVQIVLLQVVEPFSATMYMAPPLPPLDAAVIDGVYENARAYLEKVQARLRKKGIISHVHVSLGPVAGTILDLAARQKVDLIALASHGRTGLSSFFYGSVAAGVLHRADRPLLIIRTARGASGRGTRKAMDRRA